jgi:hypothetical protein
MACGRRSQSRVSRNSSRNAQRPQLAFRTGRLEVGHIQGRIRSPHVTSRRGVPMRILATNTRPRRPRGRPSDVASLLWTKPLYVPWKHDLPPRVEESVRQQTMHQAPFPTMVEVGGGEQSPARSYAGEPHHQTKSFAELQEILIRNELVGAAVGRRRVHAERGEPDAVTRFRDSGNDADR